jgi:hypothetical protein
VTDEPEPATVEWGAAEPRGRVSAMTGALSGAPIRARWRRPAVWALAGLGALAMFGSLVGDWQVISEDILANGGDDQAFGVGWLPGWGIWWMFAATLLPILVGLTLFAQPAINGHARMIGLVSAGVVLVVLAAASRNITRDSIYSGFGSEFEISAGRGLHLAFVAVALLAAAMWLASPGVVGDGAGSTDNPGGSRRRWWSRSEPDEVTGVDDGPHDLSVDPAEPDTLQR